MKNITQSIIHDGEFIKLFKDPGFYTIEFVPLVTMRIPEDEIKNIVYDLKEIIKKLKV